MKVPIFSNRRPSPYDTGHHPECRYLEWVSQTLNSRYENAVITYVIERTVPRTSILLSAFKDCGLLSSGPKLKDTFTPHKQHRRILDIACSARGNRIAGNITQ